MDTIIYCEECGIELVPDYISVGSFLNEIVHKNDPDIHDAFPISNDGMAPPNDTGITEKTEKQGIAGTINQKNYIERVRIRRYEIRGMQEISKANWQEKELGSAVGLEKLELQ